MPSMISQEFDLRFANHFDHHNNSIGLESQKINFPRHYHFKKSLFPSFLDLIKENMTSSL